MQVSRNSFRYYVGLFLREAGESVDRVGCWLQGSLAHKETLNRHRRLMNFGGHKPTIDKGVFIAPSAHVIGNVSVGAESSIWYNAVVRGDVNKIAIGTRTNIQDRVVIHVASDKAPEFTGGIATEIGDHVTVESGAILHACKLENESYIGIGATVLDGSVVGTGSMVAPGSVVTPGTQIPSGQLWAGTPAKFLRELTEEERSSIAEMANDMFLLAEEHRKACDMQHEELLRDMERTEFKEDRLEEYDYNPRTEQH